VQVDPSGRLARSEETQGICSTLYLNAGIYMMSRKILHDIPPGLQASLNKNVFRGCLKTGRTLEASSRQLRCVDIGTPERYRIAQDALSSWKQVWQGVKVNL
jgi:NDP-sugar pyrophosphorylase family protein